MLAVVSALEKWLSSFLVVMLFSEQTTSHLRRSQKKPLDRAPKRVQGMLLTSLAYDIEVQYVRGRTQHLADMMSRSYLPKDSQDTYSEFEVVNAIQFIAMGQEKLEHFRLETEQDDTLEVLKTTILKGRQEDKPKVLPLVTPYYCVSDEINSYDGLVFRGERLVVPQ